MVSPISEKGASQQSGNLGSTLGSRFSVLVIVGKLLNLSDLGVLSFKMGYS